MQTVKYFNFVGNEEDIRNEQFKWSRASTFSYDRNAIGLAVARARGGGGLQPDVATRPLERTRGMRTCIRECIPIIAECASPTPLESLVRDVLFVPLRMCVRMWCVRECKWCMCTCVWVHV